MSQAQPQTGRSPSRIFISYRRQETDYPAGWLFDRLHRHFPGAVVFKDIDSIEPGDDFVEVISSAVGSCDVLLALIGERWLTVTDDDGRRRVDDPDDFVRVEIETALARQVRVIPVLLQGARMPRAQDLPASLTGLVRRQALELSAQRFDGDVQRLLRVLDKTIAEVRAVSPPDEKAPPVPPDEKAPPVPPDVQQDVPPDGTGPSRHRFRLADRRVAAAMVATLAVLAVGIWLWGTGHGSPGPAPPTSGPNPTAPTTGVARSGQPSSGRQVVTWQSLPGPAGSVDSPAAAAHRGEIWVAGGMGRTVRVYNPTSGQWRDGPGLPVDLSHASLVSDGQRLYFIGGLGAAGAVPSVYRLDSPGGRWAEDQPLPQARFSGAAAWDGRRIVFAGGASGLRPRVAASEVWTRAPGGAWTDIGSLHSPREHLAAATDGKGSVWFLGGTNVSRSLSSDVDMVRGSQITKAASLPTPLQGLAAAWTAQSGVCAIGGSASQPNAASQQPVAAVVCFPSSRKFPDLPQPTYLPAAAVLGTDVYIVAGNHMYRLST